VDEDGRKMSKSAGNVLDPWELIDAHGADALRWLMFAEGNPWVNRRVSHHLLEDVVRRFLLTLWNTHVFFTTYAAIDGFDLERRRPGRRPARDRPVGAGRARRRWSTPSTGRSSATTCPPRPARSSGSSTTCRTGTCGATAAVLEGRSPTTRRTRPPRTTRCTPA
jgi:hypothetical protein